MDDESHSFSLIITHNQKYESRQNFQNVHLVIAHLWLPRDLKLVRLLHVSSLLPLQQIFFSFLLPFSSLRFVPMMWICFIFKIKKIKAFQNDMRWSPNT